MPEGSSDTRDRRRTRRGILAVFGVGGTATLGALLGRPERARASDGGQPLLLGEENTVPPGQETRVTADVDGNFAFQLQNLSSADFAGTLHARGSSDVLAAINGENDSSEPGSAGVVGASSSAGFANYAQGSGCGVQGTSGTGTGVFGGSTAGPGVVGRTVSGTGVSGESQTSDGVQGHSVSGFGVKGESDTAIGVLGSSDAAIGVQGSSDSGTGGYFDCQNGIALEVLGRARFSNAGAATIPSGQDSVFVANPAVTAKSHVAVTFTSDPGSRQLKWVQRTPGSGFTVQAPGPAKTRPATAFTYLVVEFT